MNRKSEPVIASQSGLSLLEVLIASAVMATIAVLSFGALNVSDRSREVSEERLKAFQQLDKAWLVLETDLRNALPSVYRPSSKFSEGLPAMRISFTEDYWLNFIRGGKPNPLGFYRTELVRVAYRLEENILWRDTWFDPGNTDPDLARKQKLLDGIENISVKVLPVNARTINDGEWKEEWPLSESPEEMKKLPVAIKVTMEIEGRGELERLFMLAPGGKEGGSGS